MLISFGIFSFLVIYVEEYVDLVNEGKIDVEKWLKILGVYVFGLDC